MQLNSLTTYPSRRLQIATYCYLGVPLLLFFLFWYRWPFAIAMVLLTGLLLYYRRRDLFASAEKISPKRILSFLPILALLMISGIGGFGYQMGDWMKHNGLLNLLIEHPWPVRFDLVGGDGILTYYLAYYLPSAVVGKLFGVTAGHIALFLWSVLGCWLVYLWILHITKLRPLFATALFLCFSGFHLFGSVPTLVQTYGWNETGAILGNVFEHEHSQTLMMWARRVPPLESDLDEVLWSSQLSYPPNFNQLRAVPQHVIAAWLLTFIVYIAYHKQQHERIALLIVATSALWSVFIAIGFVLLFALAFIYQLFVERKLQWRKWVSLENGFGLFIGLLQLFYFAGSLSPSFAQPLLEPTNFNGFRWFDFSQESATETLLLFLFSELLIWFIPLYLIYRKHKQRQTNFLLLIFASLILFFLPFVAYGAFNDLTMRSSLPAMAMLMMLIGIALSSSQTAGWHKIWLVVLLLVASVSPCLEISRQIHLIKETSYWQLDTASTNQLVEVQPSRKLFINDDGTQTLYPEEVNNLIGQYMMPEETLFGRYFVAQRRPSPPEMKPVISQITVEEGTDQGQISLVGYNIKDIEQIQQGNLVIYSALQLSGTITKDFGICIEIVHESGEIPITHCRMMSREPTFLWTVGKVYHLEQALEIPPDFSTGRYTVQFTFRAVEIGMPSIGSMTLPADFVYDGE